MTYSVTQRQEREREREREEGEEIAWIPYVQIQITESEFVN